MVCGGPACDRAVSKHCTRFLLFGDFPQALGDSAAFSLREFPLHGGAFGPRQKTPPSSETMYSLTRDMCALLPQSGAQGALGV